MSILKTYFETIRCNDYEVYNLEYHNKRVTKTIGINMNLQEYIYPPSHEELKCKVVYNQEGIIDVNFTVYKKRDLKKFKIIYNDSIQYNYKSTNREDIDKLYLQKEDCDDIIIVKNNLLTDTSIANIALLINGDWLTPKLPLLYGTCRDRLIQEEKIKVSNLTVDDFQKAKKFALMNAMIDFTTIENFIIRED